ncbi:MAG: YopX family protein [Lactiplantibacillus plantarum]|uniref:YopX family protein n=1 Tax=Lentilactobacillus parabuchneri TaxID=152331 RepID=UPI0026479741|nr:YopX family protein [Lentilactobacillus parabuchneri]MDN5992703.1 YopX family protein [Lactiplantibacillus plantarum]MDN6484422.1 YopX family protein [Lactiplantibacillus plantarum]MDN6765913.1 YopX family protein [Lactiplantibacillus plantarum]MDN6788115.1 YopX family protein [Lentilactobacillus parabuchneri]
MIKFRAWDKATSSYRKVLEIEFYPDGELKKVKVAGLQRKGAITPDKLMLEQFTGLKDVNGKPIYEGDIVHGYDQEPDRDDGYIGSSVTDVVNFKYGAFWIGDSWYKVMVMTPPIVEVIGNVHENPELMEADK